MAGRLSFAVTAGGNKVGRAFIKPFGAHVLAPFSRFPLEWISAKGSSVVEGVPFCPLRSEPWFCSRSSTPYLGTEAAGASRLLAAVTTPPRDLWFTRCRVPERTWALSLP